MRPTYYFRHKNENKKLNLKKKKSYISTITRKKIPKRTLKFRSRRELTIQSQKVIKKYEKKITSTNQEVCGKVR